MEVWVRSQTRKSLICVKGFVINEYKSNDEDRTEVTIEDADTYVILGRYPLERAKKVLDDIEDFILKFGLNKFIYEMPEE